MLYFPTLNDPSNHNKIVRSFTHSVGASSVSRLSSVNSVVDPACRFIMKVLVGSIPTWWRVLPQSTRKGWIGWEVVIDLVLWEVLTHLYGGLKNTNSSKSYSVFIRPESDHCIALSLSSSVWGEICPSCHCCQQCKFFHFHSFFVFLSLKLLTLGEIDSVKVLAWKSGSVKFRTNIVYHS